MAVMPGVLSSFATTIAVFGPLAFLVGELGAILEVIPMVLIAALAASLAEAFWVLPHHLSHGLKGAEKPPSRFRAGFDARFERFREKRIGAMADMAIRRRYLVTGATIAALIVTFGRGRVQREGGPIEEISQGDVVWFPAGEKHWHGAAPETAMSHIAIQESIDGSAVTWIEKVTDEQYQT